MKFYTVFNLQRYKGYTSTLKFTIKKTTPKNRQRFRGYTSLFEKTQNANFYTKKSTKIFLFDTLEYGVLNCGEWVATMGQTKKKEKTQKGG